MNTHGKIPGSENTSDTQGTVCKVCRGPLPRPHYKHLHTTSETTASVSSQQQQKVTSCKQLLAQYCNDILSHGFKAERSHENLKVS